MLRYASALPHTEAEVQSSEKGDLQVGLATGPSALLREMSITFPPHSQASYNLIRLSS